MRDLTFALFVFSFTSGCVTVVPQAPAFAPEIVRLAPEPPANGSVDNKNSIQFKSVEGPVSAKAILFGNVICVHLNFQNTSSQPVSFGPEDISVTDTENTLLPLASVVEVAEPFDVYAEALQARATNAAQIAHEEEHEQRVQERRDASQPNDSSNSTAQAVDGIAELFMLIGTTSQNGVAQTLQSQADDSQSKALAMRQRVQSSLLQSRLIPEGTITKGWVYFSKPTAWPTTLRVLMKNQTFSVNLSPPSDGAAGVTH